MARATARARDPEGMRWAVRRHATLVRAHRSTTSGIQAPSVKRFRQVLSAGLTAPAPAGQYHAVHFGIFVEELRHGATQAGAFRDIFETADRAEAWGIDCVWLGEIHFTPTRSIISASLRSRAPSRPARAASGSAPRSR